MVQRQGNENSFTRNMDTDIKMSWFDIGGGDMVWIETDDDRKKEIPEETREEEIEQEYDVENETDKENL